MEENEGKKELMKILNCMKDYEYDDIYDLQRGDFDDFNFRLTKLLGDSDHTIKVTIEFSTNFDDNPTHTYKKDRNNNVIDNDKNKATAREFIQSLRTHNSTKKGGQKRKQRKTRKNKK
jgi:hypothetical protein